MSAIDNGHPSQDALLAAAWREAGGPLSAVAAVKDLETGRYLWADPALSRWLGASGDGLAGGTDSGWADPATAARRR